MSGSPAPVPPDGPGGLIVLIRDDPDQAARALADELGVELAVGGLAAAEALRRHTERAEEEPAPATPLDRLAEATRRAEAVGARTRARAAESLARTINTELAIHPETLRRAAEDLLAASAARASPTAGRRPAALVRAGAASGLAVGGIAIAGLVALPVGVAVSAAGVLGALAERAAARRVVAESLPGLEASEAQARRRWEQLAGADADPVDAEAIAHRYDPQHEVVADLVRHHPAVRAADRATARHRAAWVQAWREELGDRDRRHLPPSMAATPGVVTFAATSPAGAVATLVVVAPYVGLTDERARELHQQLLTLPAGRRVVVVLGPDAQAHAERANVLDLRDRPRLLAADAVGLAGLAIPLGEVSTGTAPPHR